MTRFAPLYTNSEHSSEGESIFLQAIDYQRIIDESSWPKDRQSLLLLKGLALMFSKNGKMEKAAEVSLNLRDASTALLGREDEITTWAATQVSTVRDRKVRVAENEQRAVIASQGGKLSSSTPTRTKEEYTPLMLAAQKGDIQGLLRELFTNVSFNRHHSQSEMALHLASGNGHDAAVRILLGQGVDVNSRTEWGFTHLQRAVFDGHTAVVEALLNHGANVNMVCQGYGTALHLAIREGHTAVVETLLNHEANVNMKCEGWGTALHTALHEGHVAVVEMLLSYGANVNVKTSKGRTALQEAFYAGHNAVIDILSRRGTDIDSEV